MTGHLIGQHRDSESQHVRDTHSDRCGVSANKITPSSLPGIGVTAVWPRHRPVMPTSRKPANIPVHWCSAVGRLAVYDEEEVTCPPGGLASVYPKRSTPIDATDHRETEAIPLM